MGNCNKVSHTCGSTNYASCIHYEGNVNEGSSLSANNCRNIEDTTQDVYDQLADILAESDLSALGNQCLEYTTVEGKIFVKNALLKMEEEICTLKNKVATLETTAICDMPISACNLNFDCLVPACGTIETLGDLLQTLITKACAP